MTIQLPPMTDEKRESLREFHAWRANERLRLAKNAGDYCDLAAEYALLLAALGEPAEALAVGVWLRPSAFSVAAHGKLWQGILDHHGRGEPVDLWEAAGGDEPARAAAVVVLTVGDCAAPWLMTAKAKTIAKWATVRAGLATRGAAAAKIEKSASPDEVLERLVASNVEIPVTETEAAQRAVSTMHELAAQGYARFIAPEPEQLLLSTSIPELDEALGGGLRTDRPTVIAAGTGIGKTALATQVALHAARSRRVYYVTAESTGEVWQQRALANHGSIHLSDIQDKRGDPWLMREAFVSLSELDIHLDDCRVGDRESKDVDAIAARVLAVHRQSPIGLLVVDYITKLSVRGRFDRPDLRVQAISDKLASLCKQLGCPTLVLSQLNEVPAGQAPTKDNLSESRKVGHDAGAVLILWRQNAKDESRVECVIAKNALGKMGSISLSFNGPWQKFAYRAPDVVYPTTPAPAGGKPNKPKSKGRGRQHGFGETVDD